MISLLRLKIDSWVQLGLGIGCLLAWTTQSFVTPLTLVWILWLWQTGSALELWLDYRHHSRKPYLWFAPVLLIGAMFYSSGVIFLAICAIIYGWHTLRDYLIVRRRPKSFWEL